VRLDPRLLGVLTAATAACTALSGAGDLRVTDARQTPDDASTISDAGDDAPGDVVLSPTDAATDADTGSGTFCDIPNVRLCVTFDGPNVHTSGVKTSRDFEAQTTLLSPSPVIDTGVFVTPPGSGRFQIVDGHSRSYVTRTFADPVPALLVLTTSIRIDAPVASDADLVEIRFGEPHTRAIFLQWFTGGALVIRDSINAVGTDYPVTGSLGTTFKRITWTLENGTSGKYLTVDIDGTTALARTAINSGALPSPMTFVAGVTDADTTAASESIWFDDYVVAW
jgi:hypothetical protein